MPRRKSLRSQPYRGARDLGNLEAAEKGPASLGKRYVRRASFSEPDFEDACLGLGPFELPLAGPCERLLRDVCHLRRTDR
jgi:hypothetical protein